MNEAEVHELKDKLLKCDKTIHLQQLGMQWSAPVDENTSGVNETKGNYRNVTQYSKIENIS